MNIFIKDGERSRESTLDDLFKMAKDPDARSSFSDDATALIKGGGRLTDGLNFPNRIKMKCVGQDGNLKWENECDNLVTNVGLQHILDILFVSATAQVDPWYVGLINDNSAAFDVQPADTMASHATWTEDQTYTEANRVTYVDVRSGQSVDNSGTTADFSINGTTVIAGAFLTSDNTKGGTSGTLLCGGAFTAGERSVINGDTLQVTYTFTAADDGV
jgi:hypothetical protein